MTRMPLFFLLASIAACYACSSPAPRADDVALPERKPPTETDDERDDEMVEEKIADEGLLGADAGAVDAEVKPASTSVIIAVVDGAAPTRYENARATYYEKSGALALGGGSGTPYVNLFVYDRAPGVYTCTNAEAKASMIYRTPDGTYQGTSSMGSCSTTVISIGVPGERIIGTFTAKLSRVSGGTGPTSIEVKGSFDVIRKADVS